MVGEWEVGALMRTAKTGLKWGRCSDRKSFSIMVTVN